MGQSVNRYNRFESQVQLGLLAIVLTLLCVDVAANYIIFRARETATNQLRTELKRATVAASRALTPRSVDGLPERTQEALEHDFDLAGLLYIPARAAELSESGWRPWLTAVSDSDRRWLLRLMGEGVPAEVSTAPRRIGGDYYAWLHTPEGPEGRGVIVAIAERSVLSWLDTAGHYVLWGSALAPLTVLALYLLLVRLILRPFRLIRRQAERAGRNVADPTDDAAELVIEYRRIIEELRDKESQLTELNRRISSRAETVEEFNRYLLRSMSSGVIMISSAGKIAEANRAACDMLRVDRKEIEGRHYFDLLKGNVALVNGISRALECNQNSDYAEVAMKHDDGALLSLGAAVSVVCDNEGKMLGASLILNDLTELTNLRQDLEGQKRLAALGEMAAGLAHQLRNSIGAIVGYATLVGRRMRRAELDTRPVESLADETREAEKLIERFLSFTRPFKSEPQLTQLRAVIEDAIQTVEMQAECSGIQIKKDLELNQPVQADPLLLKQTLINLIENAANAYGEVGGEVQVSLARRDNDAEIVVSDCGCGIPPEDQEKVFTPFYSSRPGGTGLGLPLAARIVDMHGGHIHLESEPGKGTRFTICLPLVSAGDSSQLPPANSGRKSTAQTL